MFLLPVVPPLVTISWCSAVAPEEQEADESSGLGVWLSGDVLFSAAGDTLCLLVVVSPTTLRDVVAVVDDEEDV